MEGERERARKSEREERRKQKGGRGGSGRGGDLSFIPVISLDKRRFLIWALITFPFAHC